MANNKNIIKLNTGLKSYDIYFEDRDEYTTVSFNPFDPDLIVRFNEFQTRCEKKLEDVKDIELDADGMPVDDSYVDSIKQTNKIIKDELDIAFGSKISANLFKYCNPMAIVNGDYFVINFIKAIAPILEEEAKAEQKRLAKHTEKYIKNVKK